MSLPKIVENINDKIPSKVVNWRAYSNIKDAIQAEIENITEGDEPLIFTAYINGGTSYNISVSMDYSTIVLTGFYTSYLNDVTYFRKNQDGSWDFSKLYGEHQKPSLDELGYEKGPTYFTLNPNYIAVRTPERTSAQYYEFWDNNVGWADIKAREFYAGDGVNKVYHAGNKPTAADIGAAASSHNHSAANITSGTLGVARGGTGATSFTVDHALIGNGTSAVKTRAITNNTSMATCSGTNLATCNTVNNHVVARLNRGDSITAANTAYTTHMARAIALNTAVPSSLTNGCVTFVYA